MRRPLLPAHFLTKKQREDTRHFLFGCRIVLLLCELGMLPALAPTPLEKAWVVMNTVVFAGLALSPEIDGIAVGSHRHWFMVRATLTAVLIAFPPLWWHSWWISPWVFLMLAECVTWQRTTDVIGTLVF